MTAFTGLLISCAMPATSRPIDASFSERTRLSCARRSFSSASCSSALRCSSTSVRRRTSRSRSMFSDSVERSLSRSARRISSNARLRRPISSASPEGGTGRASSPRAISSERSSSARTGPTRSRTISNTRPSASDSASVIDPSMIELPWLGDSANSSTRPDANTVTLARKNTSFARSVIVERISATGMRWRAPSCASSGRNTSRSSSVSYRPIASRMSPLAPSNRPAVPESNPNSLRPMMTTATTANAHASTWYPARRYGSPCAARNAAIASGSSRAGPRVRVCRNVTSK